MVFDYDLKMMIINNKNHYHQCYYLYNNIILERSKYSKLVNKCKVKQICFTDESFIFISNLI